MGINLSKSTIRRERDGAWTYPHQHLRFLFIRAQILPPFSHVLWIGCRAHYAVGRAAEELTSLCGLLRHKAAVSHPNVVVSCASEKTLETVNMLGRVARVNIITCLVQFGPR